MNRFLQSDTVWRRFVHTLRGYGIVLLDEEGIVVAWNDGAKALHLYEAAEIIGKSFAAFYTSGARAIGHPEHELAAAASTGRYEEEGWRVRKGGSTFWAHVIVSPIFDDSNVLCGFTKIVRDATAQKQMAEQSDSVMKLLEETALTDYLTGLDNRRSLDRILRATLSRARRYGGHLCLAIIDFDHFKDYNDNFGHQAGDALLRQAAVGWRAAVRSEDFVARYGGEEFVVLMPDTGLDGAVLCMERLQAATPAPMTCSIGLALWDDVETPNALIGRANQAVYRAKECGRDCLIVAPPVMVQDPETLTHPDIGQVTAQRLNFLDGPL